jgi:L-fuculose-phosphate aldolase
MDIGTEALRRAELVAVGAALARRGLIRGREGNFSCRLDAETILVSPRGADKGRLAGSELVSCRLDEPPPPQASSEVSVHLTVYWRCPPARAIVHAHPPAVLALATRALLPDPSLLEEGRVLVPRLEIVAPMAPGSEQLALACAEALARAPVVVVRGHGVFCIGDDPWQALERVEVVDVLAGIALTDARMGVEI